VTKEKICQITLKMVISNANCRWLNSAKKKKGNAERKKTKRKERVAMRKPRGKRQRAFAVRRRTFSTEGEDGLETEKSGKSASAKASTKN